MLGQLRELSASVRQLERLTGISRGIIQFAHYDMNLSPVMSENGLFLLNNDDVRQDEFVNASDFKIDYKQNQVYISNKRYKLSASSSFYLKMAARFALFFASLQVDSMLYPRFMFSDNMEDKGMEEKRARNF